jgi:uncharacterized protein
MSLSFDDFSLPQNIDWQNADTQTLFDLSLAYANGEVDDEPNYILAHIFLNIAASRGCQRSIEYRKELAHDMSHDEIAKAQKIARSLLTVQKPKTH